MNVVVITGRIGKDPDLKVTPSGKSVCSFSIAVDEGYGDKKVSNWYQIEVWDKTAEIVNRLSGKGKRITVQGRLATDAWEQNGERKTRIKIIAEKVDIIDFREVREQADGYSETDSDDIPF